MKKLFAMTLVAGILGLTTGCPAEPTGGSKTTPAVKTEKKTDPAKMEPKGEGKTTKTETKMEDKKDAPAAKDVKKEETPAAKDVKKDDKKEDKKDK